MFQALRTWLDHRRFLREERSAEYHNNFALGAFFRDQIGLAQRTFKSGNREAALDIWRQMFVRFPYLSAASTDGIDLALNLGLYDEVEALLQDMRRRYPNYEAVVIAAGLARVAYHRGHPEEAVRRAKVLIKKYPTASQGYHLAADYLDGIGRHDEADAIIARAASKLPTNNVIMVRHANRAMRQHAWPEALRRWELIRRQFDDITVPLGIAQCLREMNCLAAAEKVLAEARAHNKLNGAFFVELANLMTAKGDFDASIGCWRDAIKWNPRSGSAYINGAAAMRRIGREADADEFLRTAMNICRANLSVHLEYARNADRRRDGVAAKERWAIVRDRFPHCAEARKQDAETIAVSGPRHAS